MRTGHGGSFAARHTASVKSSARVIVLPLRESLGLSLFTRSQLGLLPTPTALELKPHAEAMGGSAAAVRNLAGQVKRSFTVSASDSECVQAITNFGKDFNSLHFSQSDDRLALVTLRGTKGPASKIWTQ